MTYDELKNRLTQVEATLKALGSKSSDSLDPSFSSKSIIELTSIKESILTKMNKIIKEEETMFVSTKGGDTKAVKMDMKTAMDLKKDPAITGIDTAKGKSLKETEGIKFSTDETKAIAKSVGKALILTLKKLGDEIARIKAHRIEENSFDVYVEYKGARAEKGHGDDEFSFYIKEDSLHLVDFSFDKELVEVGVKPSGEAIVNVDVLSNELLKHFKSLSEDYDPDQEQKDDEEDHGVGYDDEGRPLGEGEGDDHHYIKVKAHDYKKAMAILDQNVDPTYVKMEVVDNDGNGNVIIYFIFKHEDGFDDMYDDSENPDSEFYQEPDEDPQAFVYDVVMDLRANDIELADHSADMDEATNFNDPVLMKMRVAKKRNADFKKLDAYSKSPEGKAAVRAQASAERKEQKAREIVRKLKIKRAQVEREMENDPDIESTGGPVADMYGDQLNKIDNAIEKAASIYNKPMDYDTAVGKVNEGDGQLVTFGYDLDMIQQVVDHLQKKYIEGDDFELHIGRGDDLPNAVTLKNPALEKDYDLNDMLNAAQSDEDRYDAYTDGEDTDYAKRRREEDDYYEDPDYYKESVKEESIAKISKGLDQVKAQIKTNLDKYKSTGDEQVKKAAVEMLKKLNDQKKQLEKHLDNKVAGTGSQYTEPGDMLNEYAARDLDEIFGALGYRQGFDEFIDDNPGCVEVIMEWIGSIRDFQQKLSQEYDNEELENLGFYFGDDDMYENVNESLNPEVSKSVDRFIKAMAKRYGYEEQDAVYAIMAALKQRKFDGLNEDLSMKIGKVVAIKKYNAVKNQKEPVDVKITDYIKKPGSKDFVEYELKGKKRKVSIDVFKSTLAENMVADKDIAKEIKKLEDENPKGFAKEISRLKVRQAAIDLKKKSKNEILKEFTDHRFKGSEVIDDANERGPDMFGKGIFADLLPKGVASENDAVEALKAHDKSPIKHRMGRYAPMFVHVQYHNLEHEGEEYQMHQTQYYNSNFKDKDPNFNPGVSKITLFKDPDGEDTNLGTIIVKTDEYVQDLRNLPGLGKRHMEEASRKDLGMSSSVSKRRAKAELKKPGNDGSKVYGLDKDGKRVHIKSINDVDKFKKFELDADIKEAGPGFKHDCAAKVIHKEHGTGNCIPEKHTLVKEGKKYVVTHYDVLFENGKTVTDIPVSELEIKTQNEHWHKGYKKKKK